MALVGSSNDEKIWNYLYDAIGNEYGTAALMGNLYAISCLNPKWVGLEYRKKTHLNNEQYIKLVEGEKYYNFIKDGVPFGIGQWYYWIRKRDLQNFAIKNHKGVADLETQLEFLISELQKHYKIVWRDLTSANSILTASNSIISGYENNSLQDNINFQIQRANYGVDYFNRFSKEVENELITKQIDFINYLTRSKYSSEYMFSEDIHYISNTGTTDLEEDVLPQEFGPTPWYNGSWSYIFRHPDNYIKLALADIGVLTNSTGLVKYSLKKDDYFQALAKSSYRPDNIKTSCSTNCCHMIEANIRAIGYLTNNSKFKDFRIKEVKDMYQALKNLKFEVIDDRRQLVYPDFLLPGDILINDDNRATINLTLGKKYQDQIKEALT